MERVHGFNMPVDSGAAVPARYRHVRMRGLLRCCVESIEASGRLTQAGSQLQCHVCEAVVVVDNAGAWCWQKDRRDMG